MRSRNGLPPLLAGLFHLLMSLGAFDPVQRLGRCRDLQAGVLGTYIKQHPAGEGVNHGCECDLWALLQFGGKGKVVTKSLHREGTLPKPVL